MGTVHGAFADCRNYLPGMFVAVDNYDVINFLYKEAYGSGLYLCIILHLSWIYNQSLILACDARGIINKELATDGPNPGYNLDDNKCECKPFVTGEFCNECSAGTWNLTQGNPLGCQGK